MNVAIIPARGGSTRITKKNIKEFSGEPIISYSIKAAKESGLFGRVIVSTDCERIAEVARRSGAEVPFMRPAELGRNEINVADVVCHAISQLQKDGCDITYACCITATAPFLQSKYLAEGFGLISEHDVDSVVSITRFPFPVFRAFKKDTDGRLRFIWPEYEFAHSNNLSESYHDAAQFYWVNVEKFLVSNSIMGKEVLPVLLPEYLVVDIDTATRACDELKVAIVNQYLFKFDEPDSYVITVELLIQPINHVIDVIR